MASANCFFFFFFNDTATTEIYTLSLHDALPILSIPDARIQQATVNLFADMGVQPGSIRAGLVPTTASTDTTAPTSTITSRSEEHTSELQSQSNLVCRLLLEKKKTHNNNKLDDTA